MPPGVRESMLGYHSCNMKVLTCTRESGWGTLSGGQFDWGRSPKGNEASKVGSARTEIVQRVQTHKPA